MKVQWINLSSEATDAARWCAKRGYKGKRGDPLPQLISTEAMVEINEKNTIFRMAVNHFKAFGK